MANRIYVSTYDGINEPDWLENAEHFVAKAAEELGYSGQEISILFCGDSYIQELNKLYRNIDAPTDVLSFENDEEYEDEEGSWKCVGDIVISLDTLPVNAEYFNEDKNAELKRLLVHGLLHLNGMDHGEEHIQKGVAPVCQMLVLQETILEKLKDEIIIK
ncbi:MAG: rRNA maturation RNase YbeY [Treponema sp.]|nr:rRNA maturation RNase YbeY [Treponema sp.]